MSNSLLFDPLIDPSILAALAAVMLATIGFALWRGLRGWALRGLGALVILLALAGPVLQREDRAPLSDIVLLVEDETASQSLGVRGAQTETAVAALAARLEGRKNTEVRRVTLGDGADDSGTALMGAVTEALSREPSARVAGIIAVTDGIVHDAEDAPAFPAPFHVVQTGQATDWDRRITVKNAPAFGILGEPIVLTLRVDDLGQRHQRIRHLCGFRSMVPRLWILPCRLAGILRCRSPWDMAGAMCCNSPFLLPKAN